MEREDLETVSAAIGYIESHLNGKLDLGAVAGAVHYSKYHLHRMFRSAVGLSVHDYTQRRQLTEAARRLSFSQQPILEVALFAGYDSQQAFTSAFKAMYKQTPAAFRAGGKFYPLQLRYVLNRLPSLPGAATGDITYATPEDLSSYMAFLPLVIDGFPHLEEPAHLEQLRRYMERGEALLMRDGETVIGAMTVSRRTGNIDFLATHPQYRRHGVEEAFLDYLTRELLVGTELSITTFRAGDRADTGQRAAYQALGFTESAFLTEFDYPTQRLVLVPGGKRCAHG